MADRGIRVVFLDIDGVLINRRYASKNTADPRCVAELNRITDTAKAVIVVSSSWKHYGIEKITLILRQWGVTGEIAGVTPDIKGPRMFEITKWIDASPDYDWENSAFVVIDDELDAMPFEQYRVLTDFEYGLNVVDADKAITILLGLYSS